MATNMIFLHLTLCSFDVEAEQKKWKLSSSFLVLCGRMKNNNYIYGWTWNTELTLMTDLWLREEK